MKKLIPFIIVAALATGLYSCQKDAAVAKKSSTGTLAKKDTTPPPSALLVKKDTTPPPSFAAKTVARDTTPPPSKAKAPKK